MIAKPLLVINPYSGKGNAKRAAMDIIMQLSEAGCEVTVLPTKQGRATADAIADILRTNDRLDSVIACGGDGTLNLTVDGVLASGRGVPVGYIPFGSTNDFASSLEIPFDHTAALQKLLTGEPIPHDVGRFGDKPFVYIACCGAFTETSYNTKQTLKNLLGHTAYIFNAIPSLSSMRPLSLTIDTENEHFAGDFIFCALANTTTAGGLVKLTGRNVEFNDGMFELVLVRYPNDLVEAGRVAAKLLASDLNDQAIVFRHINSCRVVSSEPIGWSLDGEDGGKHVLADLSVEKSAVSILK